MGANDEMCNLYLMYYTKKENARYRKCWSDNYPKISAGLPDSSKEPPPHNEKLESRAKHSKSKDLSQTDEEEHQHRRKGGRRKGDLDSPAGDPSAMGETVPGNTPQDKKVRRGTNTSEHLVQSTLFYFQS